MKNVLMFLCVSFLIVACGEKPKDGASDHNIKQPFSLSDDVQTKENKSE